MLLFVVEIKLKQHYVKTIIKWSVKNFNIKINKTSDKFIFTDLAAILLILPAVNVYSIPRN